MQTIIKAVTAALSPARMATYEAAANLAHPDDPAALALYAWNAQVSAAFLVPLHICEVVYRNAVSDGLEAVYGNRWPWSPGFEQSLSAPKSGYSPRYDLQNSRARQPTTGKTIAELKFVFWQSMFTSRHDQRIWNPHLRRVLPNLDPARAVAESRSSIFDGLEQVRRLRNRIAHHEPIFTRDLNGDLRRVAALIELRCKVTADWMMASQHASMILARRP
jgi:hypothetical protein